MCILNKFLNKNDHSVTTIEIFEEIHKYVDIEHSNNLIHACEILSRKHSDSVDTLKYQKGFCVFENDKISFNKDFIDELESNPMSSGRCVQIGLARCNPYNNLESVQIGKS